jgi:hypothetical protein
MTPRHNLRNNLMVRGIYGGVPTELLEGGRTLADAGFNAVWMGSATLTADVVAFLHAQNAFAFAEFNTLHHAAFLTTNPDAAPVGVDGNVCPPPDGWQGVCPTHPGCRAERMTAFGKTLADFSIDGIWLDYHHSHAAWEQAEPNLPDTCFCARCLAQFEQETGRTLPDRPVPLLAEQLLGPLRPVWTAWRCAVFTDWVREFREIRDAVRPDALLGTFHCPWTDTERAAALTNKLAIDLRAQREHLDVFSPMPYHARFGHADDIDWIARQVTWLGDFLTITGAEAGGAAARGPKRIWPIVQLSDWGEPVRREDVVPVLRAASRLPATGITVFNWGSLRSQPDKGEALSAFYRQAASGDPSAA